MGLKRIRLATKHSPPSSKILLPLALLLITPLVLFVVPPISHLREPFFLIEDHRFHGDLREAHFAWNKLCFGPTFEKLKLAVFSKTWPVDATPGGMEHHASTLFNALAAKGHEVHVFTVPSDRHPHHDIQEGNLHVHFTPNNHGSLNCSLAFEIFNKESFISPFDYVHTESVSLPHWRTKAVPNVAVTWHGVWYEIIHSKLFQELLSDPNSAITAGSDTDLREALPRLVDEIRFFASYTQHICISNSASEVLVNIYQLPSRNVHVILNGVDHTKFDHNPSLGLQFRQQHGVPPNATIVMGVAGRLVRDKGHPLLHKAFSSITKRHPGVHLLVAGSGPWEKRYAELGSNVKVLGALDPSQLVKFYNALDIFVNPTLRPQGLDLTLIEAMQCGKPVLTPNFPSITGTVVVSEEIGYTFSPNVGSFVEACEMVIRDGHKRLHEKGMACKSYAMSMFTATKMTLAYERFFLCMKNSRYCSYPLHTDC
ncbi:hypothetical protein Sjap_025895 [Stephania japonica]|uniref:Uncharacterized protein n=1 Tax=Stephania japonica TaxID=461633 RepID=A0AAP0HG13_9MAGN